MSIKVNQGGYFGLCQVLKICAIMGLSVSLGLVIITQSPDVSELWASTDFIAFAINFDVTDVDAPYLSTAAFALYGEVMIDTLLIRLFPFLFHDLYECLLCQSDLMRDTCRVVASVNICDPSALHNLALLNIKFI